MQFNKQFRTEIKETEFGETPYIIQFAKDEHFEYVIHVYKIHKHYFVEPYVYAFLPDKAPKLIAMNTLMFDSKREILTYCWVRQFQIEDVV